MATVQIRDLDEGIVETYRRLAKLEGRSLQQYMKEFLTRRVPGNSNAAVFGEIERSGLLRDSKVTFEDIVADIRAARDHAW
ncbi:MAG: FitA-like ribbon-helix-helix domain-containing protein [Mycobacteriales bacterium]